MTDQTGDALDGTFADLGREVGRLSRRARRTQLVLLLTVASLLLDLLLSLLVWRVAVTARDASRDAASARRATSLLCEAGNESRRQQADGWHVVIALSAESGPTRPQTADEKQRSELLLKRFEVYLHSLETPRDCRRALTTASTSTSRPTPAPTR